MAWNYRVVRKGEELGIYSVYYYEDGSIRGISLEPETVVSYSVEDIEDVLDLMRECLYKPIVNYNHEEQETK